MPGYDVSSKPIDIRFSYVTAILNDTNTSYASSDISTMEPVVEALDPSFAALFAPLQIYLTTPLGQVVDDYWTSIRSAQNANAVSSFIKQAGDAGQNVVNVSANLPASGVLTAQTSSATPATPHDPGTPGDLTLSYALPGCSIYFGENNNVDLLVTSFSYYAAWNVDFDATLTIAATVPLLPFDISAAGDIALSNANLKPLDAGASFDDALSILANAFTFGAVPNVVNSVESGVDGASQPESTSGIGALLSSLNAAGPLLNQYGFTQCDFSIANQDQLRLTITHPQDAAPVIWNPDDPGSGVLSYAATLSTTAVEVTPGQSLTAIGQNFPVEVVDQLTVEWNNTSTGPASRGQVMFEPSGASTSTTKDVAAPSGGVSVYAYTATGLKPNTPYRFRARCADLLSWSSWSHWLDLSTAATSDVQLILSPGTQPSVTGVQVGAASLAAASSNWSCPLTIPAGASVGPCTLTAVLKGAILASTQLRIAQTLTPRIQVIDASGAVILSPNFADGEPFTVRASNFPDDDILSIEVNGQPVATGLFAPNGAYTYALLTAPGAIGGFANGAITVTATDGVHNASVVVDYFGAPK